MRRFIFINMFVLLSVGLSACGGTGAPAETGSSGQVNITVGSNPDPATAGDIELILTITDAQGNPLEGASVEVSADHIDMTGMTMSGAATEQGSGKYAINANFSMSGNWKLTVYVRKDNLDYQEDIAFKVR